MALDYDNRVDFRAFDVMVCSLDNATMEEMRIAHLLCQEMSKDMRLKASQRNIWKRFATMINPLTKN